MTDDDDEFVSTITDYFTMRKIFILSILIFSAFQSGACPICGCGVGGFYIGILPSFDRKFMGVRYQYMRYETHIANDASQFSHDYYRTLELWGGWSIGKKWQI